MLGRSAAVVLSPTWGQQVRGMATLKDISTRLKSVRNIQKITKSMKMVSAAKYARADRELKKARPYGQSCQAFFTAVDPKAEEGQKNHLVIAMTSDRGLCGGVHSNVSKAIKAEYQEKPADVNYKIVCVGDKSKAALSKMAGKDFLLCMNNIGKTVPSFDDAAVIASAITNSGYEFESAKIHYNYFKSVVSYDTTSIPVYSEEQVSTAPKMNVYDSVDADVLKSFMEFSFATQIFYVLKEGACSEQSARMTAMDGASKNAGEMIEKLEMTYNRTRQAVITRELIEIISGAAAL